MDAGDHNFTATDSTLSRVINIFLLTWMLAVSYPLFIFSWYRFIKHRKERYFQQRGVTLIVLQLIIMTMHNCIASPLELMYDDLKWIHPPPVIGRAIEYLLSYILIVALFCVLCLRVWLINYANQLQLELSSHECEQQFHAFRVDETSFYIRNRRTLGSSSFLATCFGIAYAIYFCADLLVAVLVEEVSVLATTAVWAFLLATTIVTITVIWCKYPTFSDNFYIRNELKLCLLYILSFILVGLLFWLIAENVKGAETLIQWPLMLIVDGLCYLAVLRVIRKNNYSYSPSAETDLAEHVTSVTLGHVLANTNSYTAFMAFLVNEFAAENLCFITEYLLFRDSLNLSVKEKTALRCNADLSVPQALIKSEFCVENVAALDAQQFIAIATAMCNKYIRPGVASHEINISYDSRLSLMAVIDPKSAESTTGDAVVLPVDNVAECIKIVLPVLEEILSEILQLLTIPFARFKLESSGREACQSITRKPDLPELKITHMAPTSP